MELDTGMNEEQRAAISGALSKILADDYLLYLKTQNFHWNVTGPEFFSLHKMFEKQYVELAEAIDEIAERIRALGFYVEATTEAFRKFSSIKEDHRVLSKHEMLEQLVKGHEIVIRESRNLSKLAEKHNDPGTVDLMGRRLNAHEKAAWMLRSQL
ncbi:MAG: DNA starvation/stationary phase protection protein [Chlamydiae bacterium]|nr:DNA starvation/stationary phase protection protein [Chlamydiota bacterium]